MKLQVPFVQLPLTFDATALAAEIDALGEHVWRPHPQGFPGNSALSLIAVGGDPANDAVQGPMRPTPHLLQLPYMRTVLTALGGVLGRTRLMRLAGEAEVSEHVDVDYYWRDHMRIHVPIRTQPEVRFHCAGQVIHMGAGECWIFDTWEKHRVLNSGTVSRIHLVADSVGGAGLWPLITRGRVPTSAPADWSAQYIPPGSENDAWPEFESVNFPKVMSPWELRSQLEFLLGECDEHPQLPMLKQLAGHFGRHWRSLWARFGDTFDGTAEYKDALRIFDAEIRRIATDVSMRNGVKLAFAMRKLVLDVALSNESAPVQADERSARTATA